MTIDKGGADSCASDVGAAPLLEHCLAVRIRGSRAGYFSGRHCRGRQWEQTPCCARDETHLQTGQPCRGPLLPADRADMFTPSSEQIAIGLDDNVADMDADAKLERRFLTA